MISVRSFSGFLMLLLCLNNFGQQTENDKLILDLSGGWGYEGVLPGEGVKKLFHEIKPDCGTAIIPGDVYTDLWRDGRIDDPHFGNNSQKAKWAMDYEWWYFKKFNLPEEMEGKQVRVMFEGVDYECDVWFNGEYLGNHQGAYSRFSYDITALVKPTTPRERRDNNFLSVRLAPPPRTFALVSGRKYRWHGDYGNNVTPFGIWRPVGLEATGPVSISDTYVESELQKNGSANLNIQVELFNNSYSKRDVLIDVRVKGKNFESKTYTTSLKRVCEPGETVYDIPLEIKDPKLWWTWDLGDQNMYDVDVSVKDASGFQDREVTATGIRKLEMAMNPGWTKEQVEYPWTPMINDKRHYMRSACWGGPPDMFTGRIGKNTYREFIRLAKEANINNLRIFNWHPPEIQLFYDLCDEYGITIWQDFNVSDHPQSRERAVVDAIISEVTDIVKQTRNHPSVIVYSGGEEILYTRSDSESDWDLQLITELGRAIDPYHNIHWVPTCPLSYPNVQGVFKPNESIHAHTPHYSPGTVMMEEYYTSLDYAYVPELAISSCPSAESVKKFIPEDDLWPPGPSWGYHWADLDILRIHNYEVLNDQHTDGLEEFVDATQIAQGVYFQYSLEHFRRRKPKTSGVALCHFIVHTPDMKWAIVDFYQQPKISHEYVKRAFQPLLVSLQHHKRRWNPGETFNGKIWVVNDLYEDYSNCTVEVKFLDNDKKVVREESLKVGKVIKDSSQEMAEVSVKVPGEKGDMFHIQLRLLDQAGQPLSENEYFLLVDDQEEARALMKKMGEEAQARNIRAYRTIRYFPELMGDDYVPTKLIEEFK